MNGFRGGYEEATTRRNSPTDCGISKVQRLDSNHLLPRIQYGHRDFLPHCTERRIDIAAKSVLRTKSVSLTQWQSLTASVALFPTSGLSQPSSPFPTPYDRPKLKVLKKCPTRLCQLGTWLSGFARSTSSCHPDCDFDELFLGFFKISWALADVSWPSRGTRARCVRRLMMPTAIDPPHN